MSYIGKNFGNSVYFQQLKKPVNIAGVSFDASADIAIPFGNLSSKPTTLGGYGITDAAPIASPTFTGTPFAPTATTGTNTTQIATTAFVLANAPVAFPSGTVMLFVQTAAPTGWTKSTAHDNKALRVVSGTAGSGGSTAFTSVFASRTPAGSVGISGGGVSASSLSEAQLASHSHSTRANEGGAYSGYGVARYVFWDLYLSLNASTGSNSTHTHGFTTPSGSFSGSAMDFAVAYVDTIIATKN